MTTNIPTATEHVPSSVHVPILVNPIVEALIEPFKRLPDSAPPHWVVDCTLGGGGHSSALIRALESDPVLRRHKLLAMDQDIEAIRRAQVRFKDEIAEGRLELVHQSFGSAEAFLKNRNVLGLMADLGFSSDQIDNPERGLSFQAEGPLDMRMDRSRGESCFEMLNRLSQSELEYLIRELGEERYWRRIVSALMTKRQEGQLPKTTLGLAELIQRAVPPAARYGRIHAATRTFQALRIAVNDELSQLDLLLNHLINWIKPGGRVAILSFHSLEDRKVKLRFKDRSSFLPLTKKPIEADDEEVARNPRSRSAKLRIAERC